MKLITFFRKEILPLLVILMLVTAARSSLADHYYVPSGSMEYSLMPGDRVVVDKTAYGIRLPYTKIHLTTSRGPAPGDGPRVGGRPSAPPPPRRTGRRLRPLRQVQVDASIGSGMPLPLLLRGQP